MVCRDHRAVREHDDSPSRAFCKRGETVTLLIIIFRVWVRKLDHKQVPLLEAILCYSLWCSNQGEEGGGGLWAWGRGCSSFITKWLNLSTVAFFSVWFGYLTECGGRSYIVRAVIKLRVGWVISKIIIFFGAECTISTAGGFCVWNSANLFVASRKDLLPRRCFLLLFNTHTRLLLCIGATFTFNRPFNNSMTVFASMRATIYLFPRYIIISLINPVLCRQLKPSARSHHEACHAIRYLAVRCITSYTPPNINPRGLICV